MCLRETFSIITIIKIGYNKELDVKSIQINKLCIGINIDYNFISPAYLFSILKFNSGVNLIYLFNPSITLIV